jgi:hypothetical protein
MNGIIWELDIPEKPVISSLSWQKINKRISVGRTGKDFYASSRQN